MGSTLSLTHLRGLTSGSNANEILVDSGHTLIGNVDNTASDQIVQYKWYPNTVTFDSTASDYVTVQTVNFTPKKSGNRIMARFSGHLYKYNSTNYPSSYGQLRIDSTQVWYNAYITYMDTGQYMYTLSVVGSKLSTGTSQIAIDFRIDPNSARTYIYPNTGGMEVWEVAQ